jgi:hypothetical protein
MGCGEVLAAAPSAFENIPQVTQPGIRPALEKSLSDLHRIQPHLMAAGAR